MATFANLLIHTCTIKTVASPSGQDEYGEQLPPTETSITTACRFINRGGDGGRSYSGEGEKIVRLPQVVLPGTVAINEGSIVTSSVNGYTKPFRVDAVYYRYGVSNDIHHITADLKDVS